MNPRQMYLMNQPREPLIDWGAPCPVDPDQKMVCEVCHWEGKVKELKQAMGNSPLTGDYEVEVCPVCQMPFVHKTDQVAS